MAEKDDRDYNRDPLHTYRCPADLYEQVAMKARSKDESVARVIRRALRRYADEDENFGGLETVLAGALLEFGLPPEAGLTGLLRHMQGNRALSESLKDQHIELLQQRVAAFVDGIRTMMETGQIVELVQVARSIGAIPADEGPIVTKTAAEAEATAQDLVQVLMVPGLFDSFKIWLARHGYQVFRIPGLPKKELPTYGVAALGSLLGEEIER